MYTLLSSYTTQWINGFSTKILTHCANSLRSVIVGQTSLSAVLSAIYSALAVDRAIMVCNLLNQYTVHPVYIVTKLVHDNTFSALWTSVQSWLPANSEFTKHSNPLTLTGLKHKRNFDVPLQYFLMYLIAHSSRNLGWLQSRAHWYTAYAISGLVLLCIQLFIPTTYLWF